MDDERATVTTADLDLTLTRGLVQQSCKPLPSL
jgi:hypothetical protein